MASNYFLLSRELTLICRVQPSSSDQVHQELMLPDISLPFSYKCLVTIRFTLLIYNIICIEKYILFCAGK